jgi:hypothetical protein
MNEDKNVTVNLSLLSWTMVLEALDFARLDTVSSFLGSKNAQHHRMLSMLQGTIADRLAKIQLSITDQINHNGCRHFEVVRDGDPGDEVNA